jgi:hypothetical protein
MARILQQVAAPRQLGLVSPTAHDGVQPPAFGDRSRAQVSAFVARRRPAAAMMRGRERGMALA